MKDSCWKALMLLPRDGYWNDMLSSYFNGTHLLRQKDIKDYNEIISNSSIISFVTSSVLSKINLPAERIAIPLTDECCTIEYSYMCLEKNKDRYSDCF